MMARQLVVFYAVLIIVAFSSGCSQEPIPPAYDFVEWVQVDGSCREDHATEVGSYTGELVHWRNKVTGASHRYGSVNNWQSMSVEAMATEVEHPNQYHPPFSIDFNDITAADFQSQSFVLHGISDDTKHGGGFDSTCDLSVKKRLDHLPTDKERQVWANGGK